MPGLHTSHSALPSPSLAKVSLPLLGSFFRTLGPQACASLPSWGCPSCTTTARGDSPGCFLVGLTEISPKAEDESSSAPSHPCRARRLRGIAQDQRWVRCGAGHRQGWSQTQIPAQISGYPTSTCHVLQDGYSMWQPNYSTWSRRWLCHKAVDSN